MGTAEIEALKATLVGNQSRTGWCTIAVFAGLVIEYTILLWPKKKDMSKRDFTLTVIAGIAIAGGVYGEYHFGSKASDAALRLESISESRVADTLLHAAELDKETVLLRAQLRTQGSRATLLMETQSQERFAKIEPYRGQKIEVAQCSRQDNEVTMAVISFMVLIRARGWIVSPNNPFVSCTTGLQVIVRHNAPESTRAAGAALGAVLNELGLIPQGSQPFTQLPPPKKSETPGWNPSSADTVLLVVQIHP